MYEFNGFFTRVDINEFDLNTNEYQFKDLRPDYPFFAIRLKPILDECGDDTVNLASSILALTKIGITECLALSYSTFGGPIEYLQGFEVCESLIVESSRFCSEYSSNLDDLNLVFVEKMQSYGILVQPSGYFKPFERDFFES